MVSGTLNGQIGCSDGISASTIDGRNRSGGQLPSVYVDAENPRDLCPIFRAQEIMAAKHICRIRKKPGAHRVTLAGD
jgi:hypothetical protein